MFIKSLSVKNYKCFNENSKPIEFKFPDGAIPGSGLNIFVGENGTGKTATLEAINYLTESHFAVQNKLKVFDFHKDVNEITIEAIFNQNFNYKMPETYRGQFFECNGLNFSANQRNRKSPGKLLSPSLSIATKVLNVDQNYKNAQGKEGKVVEDYHKIFDENKLTDEFNIFYFDKYRSRHITSGTFTTTFDRIVNDLNWKFLKGLREDQQNKTTVIKLANDYFAKMLEVAQKGAGDKISQEIKEFFNRDDFEKIKLDFINILWPFSDAFFALRDENEANQIPVAKLGSGIEMIFTLLLLRSISSQSKGSIIYLIDEPEISLHPQAQKKLLQLLFEESKEKQIFVSTHSSYFFQPALIESVFRFQKNHNKSIDVFSLQDGNLKKAIGENRNFFFRHRDILFTNKAIFVEGVDDFERYQKYCERNEYEIIPKHLFMMNGCDATFFFEDFCRNFGVQFFAIVDRDFAFGRSYWAGKERKKFIEKMKHFIQEKGIQFDTKKFDEEIKKEFIEKAKNGKYTVEQLAIKGVNITKIKNKNIFVLQHGEVADYLNKDGEIIAENQQEKTKEIAAIFNYIKKNLLPKISE